MWNGLSCFADSVREDFVGYTNITGDTTGEHIADSVLARLQSLGLDPSDITAQAYDWTGIHFQGGKRLMWKIIVVRMNLFIYSGNEDIFWTGNMVGATKEAGSGINIQLPKAVPLWCATHQLNRVIVQSCTEPAIRNMIGTVDSVSTIFSIDSSEASRPFHDT